jgi:hypothetical protein
VDDENVLVAEPAVSGLLRIDQAGAFALLKGKILKDTPAVKFVPN